MSSRLASLGLALAALVPAAARAQQVNDSAYTARIRELTPTDTTWKFTTELVRLGRADAERWLGEHKREIWETGPFKVARAR